MLTYSQLLNQIPTGHQISQKTVSLEDDCTRIVKSLDEIQHSLMIMKEQMGKFSQPRLTKIDCSSISKLQKVIRLKYE